MKPTSRSALGFAVARIYRVATTVCHVLWRSARPFAALAVLCAVVPLWAKVVYVNGNALNVNFATTSTTGNNSRLAANTYYGLVPFKGSAWHEMSGTQSNNRVSETASSLTDSAGNGSATVTINARIFEAQKGDAGAILLRDAAIDDYNDGKPESTLTITGIPYACYDVYLYMAGTVYAYNSPVRIKAANGTYSNYYYMPTNKEAALTSTTAQPWGSAGSWSATKLGVNVMRIADLTSSSITFATQQLSNARANFAAIQIVERVAVTTYEATLAENASVLATELDVTLSSDGKTKKLSEVTAEESVSIALAGNATISGAVKAKHLQVTGVGTLTFSESTLSSTSTSVETDLDVSDSRNTAGLGAVTIAAGKMLTVDASGTPYTTLTAGLGISTASLVSKLTIDATKVNFEATESQREQLRAFTGVVEFTGTSDSNATGATLTYESISDGYDSGFKPRFVFNKGQHTLAYGYGWTSAQGSVRWSAGATDTAPTIEVTGGAQLTFKVKDVSGWSGSTGATPSVLRVGENSRLILTTLTADTNGNSTDTGYWRDRIVLDRDATVSVEAFTTSAGANNFVLYGGAGDSDLPQLAMLDNQGEAIWNGGFRTDVNASRISIGTNSSLLLNGAITGAQSINKVGAGRLTLTGTNTNTGSLTIAAGTVRFAAAEGAATVGSWEGPVKVGAGATLEVPGTAELPTLDAASAGTVLLTGNGELDMRSAISTASALKAGFAEGATGTLIVPAGSEVANLQVPAGATLKLVLSADQLATGSYTYSFTQAEGSTVSFWQADAEGNLTEVTGTTVGSTFLPTLSFIFTNETGNGQWADGGNWLDGAVPSPTDAVEIPAKTTLTLAEDVSVAGLRVTGSGTLTVTGGTLTVTNTLFVLERLVATSSQLVFGDNLVAINLPNETSELDYTVTGDSAVALPALSGSGTFIKRGTTKMTFKDATTAYLAQVVVAEGTLDTGDGEKSGEFHITVKSNAKFLTQWDTSLTSTASTLCLEGGAILDLRNGNGWRQFQAAITIDATPEKPAIIQGSLNGPNSNLQGAITGKGTLEIRKDPDRQNANPFTISGDISDAAPGTLALKVTQTGTEAAVTLTGNNTYTGGTTIANGATVIVETIGKLGSSGTVQVDAGGTLKLVNSSDLNEEGTNYSRVTGTGTVWYSSSGGDYYRILPSTAANRLPTTISVKNDLTAGLIISQQGPNSPETAVGSVSGSGNFRADGVEGENSRTLRIVQSKNTEHTGNFINSNGKDRLTKVIVAGADGATLTLSGNTTTTARPLEIEESGSVKLTGSWDAAITINGALEVPVASGEKTISTVLAGTTGTLTKSGAGTLTLTGSNTFSGNVAITGGILNVGTNRGFTVSAIASGAQLALSPTASELEAGQISLAMADGVTLSAEQLSVTDFPGVTGAGGVIALSNPCWKPTAEDSEWGHNWYRGTTAITTVPTSGEIEVNFSALTTETAVTIPSGTFEAVTFVGDEAEGCSLVVTLGDEVALGALTVSGRVTLPDTAIAAATEVTAGATLSLTGSGATISTAIMGEGSLCQRSGATKLTGANTYTGTTTVAAGATLSLAGERVLSDAFGEGSTVVVNGTLVLANGSYCRRTRGEGTIRVLNNLTFAIGQAALPAGEQWSDEKTTGLTKFTGTLALVGNLKLTNAASNVCTYAPTGFNVRFEADDQGSSDGQLLCDETGKTSFTLAAGRTLSGKGFVKCPIAFEANSVIEVKMATNLDLSKATITLPSGEGEHILLKAAVASNGFLYVALSANVSASVFAFADTSTVKSEDAGVKVYRYQEDYDVVQVIANPTVPEGTADGVAEAIRDQANIEGMPVTVQAVKKDEKKPKVVLEGTLFFENVVKTEFSYETYQVTATVTYDFGVSAITVKRLTLEETEQLCVVVCAKVESTAIEGKKATFKESARVQLYLNNKLCDGKVGNGPLATVLDSTIDNSVVDSDKSVRWFAVPLSSLPDTGTSNFTVKVTEAATP